MIGTNFPMYTERRARAGRQGTVLICVLACVGVTAALCGTCLQVALRSRQESKAWQRLQQTEWILEAGVQFAQSRLEKEPGYGGETLDVSLEQPGAWSGTVHITVLPPQDSLPAAEDAQDRGLNNSAVVEVAVIVRPFETSLEAIRRSYRFEASVGN